MAAAPNEFAYGESTRSTSEAMTSRQLYEDVTRPQLSAPQTDDSIQPQAILPAHVIQVADV